MANPVEFNSYILMYHPAYKVPPGTYGERISVSCFMDNKPVGDINFYEGDVPESRMASNLPLITFHISEFSNIYSILLHEKPLYLNHEPDRAAKFTLLTSREPIGEEE